MRKFYWLMLIVLITLMGVATVTTVMRRIAWRRAVMGDVIREAMMDWLGE